MKLFYYTAWFFLLAVWTVLAITAVEHVITWRLY